MENFYPACHAAGKDCKLWRPNDQVADVKARMLGLMDKLAKDPFISVSAYARLPAILGISLIKQLLFSSIYFPVRSFPLIAQIADMLYRGENLGALFGGPDLQPFCGEIFPPFEIDDSPNVIGCSDWRDMVRATSFHVARTWRFPTCGALTLVAQRNSSIDRLEKSFEEMKGLSAFADVVSYEREGFVPRILS
jgi:hypothetical protein